MSFIKYVKGLRRSKAPQPFSSEVCNAVHDIVKSSRIDLYNTEQKEVATLRSDNIDILI